jgi:hypothetical protein
MKEFFLLVAFCMFLALFYLAGMTDAATDFSHECETKGEVVLDGSRHVCWKSTFPIDKNHI